RQVVRHYENYLRRYRRTALPHQIIRAYVMVGKAHWKQEDFRLARVPFEDAVRAWRGGAAEAIAQVADGDVARSRYLLEARDATSEALFHLAEYRYQRFKQIEFPSFRGARSLEGVNRWAQNDFVRWVQSKTQALQEAEQEYNKIAELEVPSRMIAAAARIGEMYRSFVDEFRDAPIPREIENDPELRDIYYGALDERSEPLVRQAVDKFEFCIRTSTNVRWFSRFSRQCEQELNRLEPREYPLAAELRALPGFTRQTPAQPRDVEIVEEEAEEFTQEGGAS
ncbi:MAG: hypothetical protein AAF550_11000, partial [Myxococcota bacterium]